MLSTFGDGTVITTLPPGLSILWHASATSA